MKRNRIIGFLVWSIVVLATCPGFGASAGQAPNVVLLLVDDLG
jgi:hypothetical protein